MMELNEACTKHYSQAVSEAAARSDVVVKSARVELDAAYDAIVERVNAYAVIEGGELYERFARTFNRGSDNMDLGGAYWQTSLLFPNVSQFAFSDWPDTILF